MKKTLCLIAACLILAFACKIENDPPPQGLSYLDAWTGTYTGQARRWTEWPQYFNESNHKIDVLVEKGEGDSLLNITFTYDDTLVSVKNDLKFSASGIHQDSWGGGSGYGSISIRFDSVYLHFDYFQKCGIPCSSGENFIAVRKSHDGTNP